MVLDEGLVLLLIGELIGSGDFLEGFGMNVRVVIELGLNLWLILLRNIYYIIMLSIIFHCKVLFFYFIHHTI